MPPELRKRKAPEAPASVAPPAKKKGPVAKAVAKVKEVVKDTPKVAKTNGAAPASNISVGDVISFDGFGGEITTNTGEATTLQKLVEESKSGVVLFTYPKASTPGCTTQVCLFRDDYANLTSTGFSIYGLSKDSPKANTTFKDKQKLPYPLLCDPEATLITAIGLKKAPSGTTRGVFVVDKSGKVLAAEPGGPAPTVQVVKKLIAGSAADEPKAKVSNGINGSVKDDAAPADVAAQVADTAEKLDKDEAKEV